MTIKKMKPIIALIIVGLLLFSAQPVLSQGPPDPPGESETGDDPIGGNAPVGGGTVLLLMMAAAYGGKKYLGSSWSNKDHYNID